MKRYRKSFFLFCMMLFLTACNRQEILTNVTPGEETEDAEGIQVPETLAAPIPLPTKGALSKPDFSTLKTLDNTPMGWGYSTNQRDCDNRPTTVISAQEQWGHLSAEFIRDNTPTIYLTFDEGYEWGCTAEILDVLKEKEVSAVFFVTMPYVEDEPELIQRMIDEGHVVGGHTVHHPAKGMPSLSLEEQAAEIQELHDYVLEHFQYHMDLFRFPAGIYSEQSLGLIQAMGYRSIFWSFAYKDWVVDDQPDQDFAMKKMVSQLHNGAIYLLHAVSETNTQVLGDFIDTARNKGYEWGYYD